MAPPQKDGGNRRKSVNPFSRAGLASIPQLNTSGESSGSGGELKERKRLVKRSSRVGLNEAQDNGAGSESSKLSLDTLSPRSSLRPRMNKTRPSSVFSSLGRKSMVSEDGEDDGNAPPTPTSPEDDRNGGLLNGNKSVLHHGEVYTSTSMFRKKREYLVLTETHLHRFKNQNRASEAFGQQSVPPTFSRSHSSSHRYPSTSTSIGSLQESINSHSSLEMDNGIPLKHIVTAYKAEAQKPFHTTEVVYLDEETNITGSMQLMLQDPREADLWHTCIRGAAQKARLMSQDGFSAKVIQFLVSMVEDADDYSPDHFKVFKVARRAGTSKTPRSSSDDVSKVGLSVHYMVIGINKLHLISIPDSQDMTIALMAARASKSAWGLLSLVGMTVQHSDDAFELIFRVPLQSPQVLELAASASPEIILLIFQAIQYLRPLWLDGTFAFKGPPRLFDDFPLGAHGLEIEEYGCFDRTLIAYCSAYGLNPANICYTIDWHVEDAPEFCLLPAASGADYKLLELLAVLRALRYNESFHAISFKGVSLQCLHAEFDRVGADHVAWTTREGVALHKFMPNYAPQGSLLFQEIRAIAVKSRRLRRVDFTDALPKRRPKDNEDDAFPDPGCEITRALLPLCRHKFTNVDWIALNGIELGETDFEILLTATAFDKQNYEKPNLCQIRAIEVSRCGLNDRGLQLILSCIERLYRTIQCIDISHNPCRIIALEQFQTTMLRCSQIRKLNLSRVGRPPNDDPLLTAQVLMAWKLEELILDGIIINDNSLDAIASYLGSEKSSCLRNLSLNQCNLTGTQVAQLMRVACSPRASKETGEEGVAEPRDLHLHVSTNRLEKGNSDIVSCIEEGQTPTQLTMRMVEYQKEDHFRQLLAALRTNKTIRSLDISKASLPYDASAETCEALRSVFTDNTTLEEFDISGEHAHLEVARFGIGLNQALGGLKDNTTLKYLTIEYQNLGLEGANTLSSVLESNSTLTHINCANNGINLQGFTVLTNAMAQNFSVVHLPMMQADCEEAVRRMKAQIMDTKLSSSPSSAGNNSKNNAANSGSGSGSVDNVKHIARRTLNTLTLGVSNQNKGKNVATIQDVEQAVAHLHSKWQVQSERLQGFLYRNAQIADGVEGWGVDGAGGGVGADENLRPATAMSDRGIIEHVLSNTTPKGELPNPVDWMGSGGLGLGTDMGMGMGFLGGSAERIMSTGMGMGVTNDSDAQTRSQTQTTDTPNPPYPSTTINASQSGDGAGDRRGTAPRPESSTSDYADTERQRPISGSSFGGISDGMRASLDLAAALDRVLASNEINDDDDNIGARGGVIGGTGAGVGGGNDSRSRSRSNSAFKVIDEDQPRVDSVVESENEGEEEEEESKGVGGKDGGGGNGNHPKVVLEGEDGVFDMEP